MQKAKDLNISMETGGPYFPYRAVRVLFNRASSSYFFLFFPIFWLASYFLLFFEEIPIFSYLLRVLLGAWKHFEIFEINLSIKLINVTKN